MCYTATLPSVIKSENLNSDLLNLTRIFNRWLKMLTSYGKLDEASLQADFTAIAKVIKSHETKKDIKRAVQRCRDYALASVIQIANLVHSLTSALNLLCKAQENKELQKLKKAYADQGMTERYRPLSKRLAKELSWQGKGRFDRRRYFKTGKLQGCNRGNRQSLLWHSI